MNASDILRKAADTIDARAQERGEESERSISLTVKMFNSQWGTNLTEQQGWSFMQHLKAARNISGHKDDDLIDKVAYSALEAECVIQARKQAVAVAKPRKPSGIQSSYHLACLSKGVWLFNLATNYVCCIEESDTSEFHPSYAIMARSYDADGKALCVNTYTFKNLQQFEDSFFVLVSTEVHAANNVARDIIKYRKSLRNV